MTLSIDAGTPDEASVAILTDQSSLLHHQHIGGASHIYPRASTQDSAVFIVGILPYQPALRAGLMSAPHSGKFARTDFTKSGFAAAVSGVRAP